MCACVFSLCVIICLFKQSNELISGTGRTTYLSVSPGIAPFRSKINISIHLLFTLLAWTIRCSVFDEEVLLG